MKRQKKLDDGLNRLFSSPKSTPTSAEPSVLPENVPSVPVVPPSPVETLPLPPPQSHLIPVPAKPMLPLQMPDLSDIDHRELENSILSVQEAGRMSVSQIMPSVPIASASAPVTVASSVLPVEPSKPPVVEAQVMTTREDEDSQKGINKPGVFADEQIVVFTLAGQYYGINIAAVEGIIKMQPITVVPRAPHYIVGVTNLRGNVVPVISLHKRLDLLEKTHTDDSRIITVNSRGITASMIVDEVNSVEQVKGTSIEGVSQTLTSIDSAFIRAIAKMGENLVILLDLEKVLQERH